MAAKGNPGVAGVISQTEGSIGYVGSEYAFAMKIQFAQMKNAAGNFITPELRKVFPPQPKWGHACRHPYNDH